MKPLVIYHGNCADGFTAAWLANTYFAGAQRPDEWHVDPVPAVYGDAVPDVTDREVYILDFSYSREQMLAMGLLAESITIIDHHQTSIEALSGLGLEFEERGLCPLVAVLSVERSGAYLTSQFFWPHKVPGEMVAMVDDRDRWQFQIPRSRPFHASLFSRFYTLKNWEELNDGIDAAVIEGAAIERKVDKDVTELLGVATQFLWILESVVPAANLPYIFASDACHKLLADYPNMPFAATWFVDRSGQRVFSLRSRAGSDVDVAKIAQCFGGGGHRHASGFRLAAGASMFDTVSLP